MKNLIKVELLKLRTTPALYVCAAVIAGLTVVSVIANILLAGKNGAPPLGSVENVNKVFSVAALSTMVAMAIGIVTVAGEYQLPDDRQQPTSPNRGAVVLLPRSW